MASGINKSNPWIEVYHSRPTAKYQVFIFPSAGSPGIDFNLKILEIYFE